MKSAVKQLGFLDLLLWALLVFFWPHQKSSGVGGSHCDLVLAPRWIPESVRWVVLSGKFSKALKILRWMAALNGKKEEGEKLSVEVGAKRDYSLNQEPSSCLCFPDSKPTSHQMSANH